MILSPRSNKNLQDVHPDLVRVVQRAADLTSIPFTVIEGRRSLERQKMLIATGMSKIKVPERGRHVTGHAVDVVAILDGVARWDTPTYRMIAMIFKEAARLEDVHITWGGDWVTWKDCPHFELRAQDYPAVIDLSSDNGVIVA